MTPYEIASIIVASISVFVAIVSIIVSYDVKKKCDKYINIRAKKNDGNIIGNVEGDANVEREY